MFSVGTDSRYRRGSGTGLDAVYQNLPYQVWATGHGLVVVFERRVDGLLEFVTEIPGRILIGSAQDEKGGRNCRAIGVLNKFP